jgi:hypothetical protein
MSPSRWIRRAQSASILNASRVTVVNSIRLALDAESDDPLRDGGYLQTYCPMVIDLFRPRAAVEAEILVLRQQIIVLRRGRPGRIPFLAVDRMVLGWVCQLFAKTREALAIVRPETVVRWHRAGFRRYWRWKSRPRRGRPAVPAEIRQLIREISVANPLWGAPRIDGGLIRLGIDRRQTSVAKYMARRRGPPSQGLKTFLHSHADGIAAMDLLVVPTLSFRLLYGLLIGLHPVWTTPT